MNKFYESKLDLQYDQMELRAWNLVNKVINHQSYMLACKSVQGVGLRGPGVAGSMAFCTRCKGPFTLRVSDAVSVSVSDAKIMGTEYYQWYCSHWPWR